MQTCTDTYPVVIMRDECELYSLPIPGTPSISLTEPVQQV